MQATSAMANACTTPSPHPGHDVASDAPSGKCFLSLTPGLHKSAPLHRKPHTLAYCRIFKVVGTRTDATAPQTTNERGAQTQSQSTKAANNRTILAISAHTQVKCCTPARVQGQMDAQYNLSRVRRSQSRCPPFLGQPLQHPMGMAVVKAGAPRCFSRKCRPRSTNNKRLTTTLGPNMAADKNHSRKWRLNRTGGGGVKPNPGPSQTHPCKT